MRVFQTLSNFLATQTYERYEKISIEKEIVIEVLKTSLDTFDANIFVEFEERFKTVEEHEQRGRLEKEV